MLYGLGYLHKLLINCLDQLTNELPSKGQKIRAAQKQIKQLDFSITVTQYNEFIAP